ncbi:hypothetical protein SAY86_025748 [Trapa natans]|uniref:CRM domain-containing protein n=1 Tax=Trapa natans TaxID=22666 RepID=A0AAN7QE73_TRANT|nr:hypothetical protein SAY86_025748 [Trapa natans]
MLLSQYCDLRHSSLRPKILAHPCRHSHLLTFSFSTTPIACKNPKRNIGKPLARAHSPKCLSESTVPQSAIRRIAEKLRSLGFTEDAGSEGPPEPHERRAGEIFVPLPNRLPKHRIGHTIDASWSTPENPVPEPGSGSFMTRYNELKGELKEQKRLYGKEKREEKVPTLAELKLSDKELRRLQTLGIGMRKKLKVGKAGITEGIVNSIHERWRRTEVLKIVCEDLCRMNMKRTHDLLERKTGGLVVWRSGANIILYRGANYKYPYFSVGAISTGGSEQDTDHDEDDKKESPSDIAHTEEPSLTSPIKRDGQMNLIRGVGYPDRVRFQQPGEAQLAEEADRLLDGLGPRFTDWWGYEPLPVDADLLPAVIPGYRRPFRLLPYGVKPKLTNDEMTTLKRLGRPLPCHFALGRNRNHQGLAAAIIKLWEKCEIVKIAVKRGVQNTNSELMAEELKHLTGGILLSRDREFFVLYRGKDFLPLAVSSAMEARRKLGTVEENKAELKQGTTDPAAVSIIHETNDDKKSINHPKRKKIVSDEAVVESKAIQLSQALEKKAKAEKLLDQLEKSQKPKEPDADTEGITKEERYMLRKVGLRMRPFLLLGRRGVFDGTIENMHLHWKYRDLVKLICKEKSIEAVYQVACTLQAESGGILVAVERVSKGYAIIIYRGKNYQRPDCIRPKTLLSKRAALKHSLVAQRQESLKLHVLKLSDKIQELKLQLEGDEERTVDDDSSLLDVKGPVDSSSSLLPSGKDDATENNSVESNHGVLDLIDQFSPEPVYEGIITSLSTNEIGEVGVDDSKSKLENRCSAVDPSCPTSGGGTVELSFEPSEALPEDNSQPPASLREIHARPRSLLKTERLLLRRQALKMKKRPVLAIGRSNIVTGVAKTIMVHFQKHPLAIVNVKGRAKGTSIQELIFQLEQETGAVLVSQEPNKVILYRGWGAEGETRHSNSCTARVAGGNDASLAGDSARAGSRRSSVSPELIAAIKLECGLQSN